LRASSGWLGSLILALLGGAATIGAWWLVIVAFGIESFLVPTPRAVFDAFLRLPGYLLENAWVTLAETVQGFLLTAAAGILVGALLAASDLLARAMYPALVALNAVPKLAFAPLLLVWLGFGPGPKVVMAALMCFFPIVLATATGLSATPAELIELTRSLSASRWQTFTRVRWHAALPQIMVGLKTAMPLAVIGALVGELFGATAGLGFVIQNAGADTALAFAAIALLALMSIALFYALVLLESRLVPWVRHTTA
jgi:NitT/TauT family transport system permease protein